MCLKRHKVLQMKTKMSGMGNKMMGNSRLDIAKENIRDLEYLARKMIKNETKTETRSSHQESKMKTVTVNCRKTFKLQNIQVTEFFEKIQKRGEETVIIRYSNDTISRDIKIKFLKNSDKNHKGSQRKMAQYIQKIRSKDESKFLVRNSRNVMKIEQHL